MRLAHIRILALVLATTTGAMAGEGDWPQYRGPKRDNVAVGSPKLLDTWPAEGPALLWKSDWIPGWYQGGTSGPVAAEGKVFVYATCKEPKGKQPKEGGKLYHVVTAEFLASAGWMADLPEELATKIEAARVSKSRPTGTDWNSVFPWWEIKDEKLQDKERDEFLAKHEDVGKYITEFIASLDPKDAKQFGDFIKKRLCISANSRYGSANGLRWEQLVQLSKLQDAGYATAREWAAALSKAAKTDYPLLFHLDSSRYMEGAWRACYDTLDEIVCLDAATGKTIWKKDFPVNEEGVRQLRKSCFGSGEALGICATPTVWKDKCYFAGAMGLYCVSAKDGELVWQVKRKPEHAAPLVADGVVYHCGTAYNAETGEVLWKMKVWNDNSNDWTRGASPTAMVSGGKTYLFASDGGRTLYCLDLQTGKDVWKLTCKDPWSMEAQIAGDRVIVNGTVYKMSADGIQPVKEFVNFPGMGLGMSWIVFEDHIYQYIFTQEMFRKGGPHKEDGLCCWDLQSGDMKWNYRGPTCTWDTDYTPSIVADGKIIASFGSGAHFTTENNSVAMFRPTPEKYVLLGTFKPDLIPWTPMAMAGGRLLVRTERGVSCYELRAGR